MKILLLGEIDFTSLYFKEIAAWNGWQMTYQGRHELTDLEENYDLFIFSDYPSSKLATGMDFRIATLVREGTGLLMVGGWSSFSGLDGGYHATHFASILPVVCLGKDDRVNVWSGLHLKKYADHPIVDGLDWALPPVICGYNITTPKPEAQVLVQAERILPVHHSQISTPILSVWNAGKGRVCAYTSDLVPHWCGGLVDWGEKRLSLGMLELSEGYVKFVSQLIAWTANQLN